MKELCEVTKVHPEVVERVQQNMTDLGDVANLFKALADETRLSIAYALTIEEEMCVCDIAAVIGSSTATASHHLRYLRERALAKSERKGKQIYYSLSDNHVRQLVKIAHEHTKEGVEIG
ncbi:Cadmium efflux system accessory protein [Planococcus halocryophilus Or1]|uniref:Transcriptional regulator n=1 Tax=Planococcus halocryophilus TaxID=1215089 RepID=A0A1C7DV30_9BACL|nr:metalloregulator ArsR/SmtB family transcription factor [Planococcus halocryophilus]ANU15073.1 transcriptional regulator [Planococcus halocryophilus]EMF45753.1 Cadmium efflux system accessory protein [Planococcus halocryophilus Or1]